jgi:hypothetical protein
MTKEMQEIRDMSKYQLELYLHKHKNRNGVFEVYLRLLNGHVSKDDRELASRIVYAQNRLRIMGRV